MKTWMQDVNCRVCKSEGPFDNVEWPFFWNVPQVCGD